MPMWRKTIDRELSARHKRITLDEDQTQPNPILLHDGGGQEGGHTRHFECVWEKTQHERS